MSEPKGVCKCASIPTNARATIAARPSRRSCSSSTSTATHARSATARCRRRWRRRPTWPSRTVPNSRSRSSRSRGKAMSARPPVKDWATDFDHLDPRWVNDPFPIWDEMRKTLPDRPHRALHGRLFPLALRRRARGGLRHRTFLLAPRHRARDAAAAYSRAAHHIRSAGAPPGAHGAAAALHARRHEETGAAGPRRWPTS